MAPCVRFHVLIVLMSRPFLVAKKYLVRRGEFAVDLSQPDEPTLSIS
jgi:hypothetical protein